MLHTKAQPVEMTPVEPGSAPVSVQTPSVVRTIALGKDIDDKRILHRVTLEVRQGEFIALLGANGAGKSTLLKVLATLIPFTSGELELFGEPTRNASTRLRTHLGLIGHEAMLYRDLSARENLVFFGRLYGLPDPVGRADELLETMKLTHRADDAVKTYSRGMTQRVSIARALMHDPDLLLADEPFAGLDAPSTQLLEQTLTSLHLQGKTIVLANHDLRQSLELAPRVVVLSRGHVALDRPSEEVNGVEVLEVVSR